MNLPSKGSAKVGINIRPLINETLDAISQNYIMIIYTASHQSYADPVINHIDPEKKYFKHRLYRQHCLKVAIEDEFVYVKDLSIIQNIDLKDVIIVDNSLLSFAFQLDNGIPILPFYDNKDDKEFLSLVNYLNFLAKLDDVRKENRKMFKLDYLQTKSSPLKSMRDGNLSILGDEHKLNTFELIPLKTKISDTLIISEPSGSDISIDTSFITSNNDFNGLINFEITDQLNLILDELNGKK